MLLPTSSSHPSPRRLLLSMANSSTSCLKSLDCISRFPAPSKPSRGFGFTKWCYRRMVTSSRPVATPRLWQEREIKNRSRSRSSPRNSNHSPSRQYCGRNDSRKCRISPRLYYAFVRA
ncbi:hypothetical protein Mapa_013855 [Marchantia paleacea]|nr:hypothetical protein Mapa_013855 [Marchantia paleacea]